MSHKNGVTAEMDSVKGLVVTLYPGVIVRYNGHSSVSVQVNPKYKLVSEYLHFSNSSQ